MIADADRMPAAALRHEILAAAERHARDFRDAHLEASAARRFAVLTCMDARIDPARLLALAPGDAQVIRNAGALATADALRSLVVAHWLLGTETALVVGHTDCGLANFTDDDIRERIAAGTGTDARAIEFLAFTDLEESVRASVRRIDDSPLLPASFTAQGFVYDVRAGRLRAID